MFGAGISTNIIGNLMFHILKCNRPFGGLPRLCSRLFQGQSQIIKLTIWGFRIVFWNQILVENKLSLKQQIKSWFLKRRWTLQDLNAFDTCRRPWEPSSNPRTFQATGPMNQPKHYRGRHNKHTSMLIKLHEKLQGRRSTLHRLTQRKQICLPILSAGPI